MDESTCPFCNESVRVKPLGPWLVRNDLSRSAMMALVVAGVAVAAGCSDTPAYGAPAPPMGGTSGTDGSGAAGGTTTTGGTTGTGATGGTGIGGTAAGGASGGVAGIGQAGAAGEPTDGGPD